jgi:hypothetical protein
MFPNVAPHEEYCDVPLLNLYGHGWDRKARSFIPSVEAITSVSPSQYQFLTCSTNWSSNSVRLWVLSLRFCFRSVRRASWNLLCPFVCCFR